MTLSQIIAQALRQLDEDAEDVSEYEESFKVYANMGYDIAVREYLKPRRIFYTDVDEAGNAPVPGLTVTRVIERRDGGHPDSFQREGRNDRGLRKRPAGGEEDADHRRGLRRGEIRDAGAARRAHLGHGRGGIPGQHLLFAALRPFRLDGRTRNAGAWRRDDEPADLGRRQIHCAGTLRRVSAGGEAADDFRDSRDGPEQLHDYGGLRHGRPGGGKEHLHGQDEHAVPLSKRNRPIRRKHAAAA